MWHIFPHSRAYSFPSFGPRPTVPPISYDLSQPTPLLDKLPVEIRDLIYDILLHSHPSTYRSREMYWDQGCQTLEFRTRPETHHHGIQLANRQLHSEFQDAIRLLVQSNKLQFAFEQFYRPPCPYDYQPALTWKLVPTLRPHLNRITRNVNFRLPKKPSQSSDFWGDQIPNNFSAAPFLSLSRLLRHFGRTIERRHGPDAAPLTIDHLVINITESKKPVKRERHHHHRDARAESIARDHPGYCRLMERTQRVTSILCLMFFGDIVERRSITTRSRVKAVSPFLDGRLCF